MLWNIGFTSVAHNDKGIINTSGLEGELERLVLPHFLQNSALPVLYTDDMYDPSAVITNSNGVNGARVDLEHEFGLASSLFKRLCVKHTWKLSNMDGRVSELFFQYLLRLMRILVFVVRIEVLNMDLTHIQ